MIAETAETPIAALAEPVWRVVIIDEGPEDRVEIRRLLLQESDRRYQFVEADTGAAGLRAVFDAANGLPACVVLDCTLPDMDAVEVLAGMQDADGLIACPVVVLTGLADPRLGPAVLRAGAQDFIGKSWMTAPGLARAVDNAAERWALTRELQARTAALRASDAQLMLGVEIAGLGVGRIDYDTGMVVLDPNAAALFGLACGVALPRSGIHATFHPDDKDEIVRRMLQSLDPTGEGTFSMEHRVVHTDGSVHWLSVRTKVIFAQTAGIRRPVTSVLAAVDITAGKQADDQLRASEQFNRSLMDGTADCVKVLDLGGRLVHMNTPGLCAMEIDDFDSVCGKEWEALWPEDSRGDIERSVARAVGGEVSSFQACCPTAKGTPKWWEVTVSPVRDADGGRVVRLLSVSRDITEQRAAEADRSRLHEQAERERGRLVDVFRQAPAFMCALRGPDHVYEMVNDRYHQLVGQREILGRSVPEALPEIEGQGFIELLDTVYRTGEPIIGSGVPVVLARQPGRPPEERFIDLVYQPLKDPGEAVTGIVIVGFDVTDRKRAEMAMRASEARYRALFESMDEGYCVIELIFNDTGGAVDYRFLEVNPAFEKHTGMAGAAGRTMREFAPDLESSWFEIYGRVAQSGESTRFIDQARALDRWFDVYAFRIGGAGSNKVAILFNDITVRKQAEVTLRASEERYRSLVIATTQIVWTSAADGMVVDDSAPWRAFTGQTVEQRLGWGWKNAIHPDDQEAAAVSWQAALATTSPVKAEYRLRRHDGEYRWMSVSVVPVMDEAGVLREWVGTNTDITERRRGEESLRQIAAELSQASRRKDEFLATLAHELRNPLAPIRTGLQLMKLPGVQQATIEQARAMMERQLTQMVRLVDDLMDVSRISLGKLELRKERISLATVLNSALETSRPLIGQMGHELTVMFSDPALMIDADMTRLAQVFLNLLNNAAKYSERGGHIRLNVAVEGSDAVVTVMDTGIGIDADQMPRIFEMYSQLGGTLERAQGGLGVGLTLVKRLVDLHGGSVEARSEGLGLGSVFIVRLPLVVETSPAKTTGVDGDAEAVTSGLRVLIVDDNRDAADSLSELLKMTGNDTRTAYDGQEGVDAAAEFVPDVILLDIGLPLLNGYEACRLIRDQPKGKSIVLIALTGWGQDDDRRRSREAGFDHHMVKPVDPRALLKMLAGLAVKHEQQPTKRFS